MDYTNAQSKMVFYIFLNYDLVFQMKIFWYLPGNSSHKKRSDVSGNPVSSLRMTHNPVCESY